MYTSYESLRGNAVIISIWHSWFSHNVEIRVKDLILDLSMSTVVGIGDLAEDEIIAKPLPLEVNTWNQKQNYFLQN